MSFINRIREKYNLEENFDYEIIADKDSFIKKFKILTAENYYAPIFAFLDIFEANHKKYIGTIKENEIVSIPGLRGRDPKEITLKNLSKIIHARVVEIIEQVYVEIKNYGHEEQKKKLIAGIVLTGGGSQLKHLKQLVEYITGMDTRVGYPNEHLAGDSDSDITSPMYATAVGLVMDSLMRQEKKIIESPEVEAEADDEPVSIPTETSRDNRSFLDKLTERVKDFLDNAE